MFISEILAANRAGLRDGENQRPDGIEIHHRGGHAVALAGWHITDDPGDLGKWTLPTGAQRDFAEATPSTQRKVTGPNKPDSADWP